jgi:NAD(P)-dependent dehydrogenase (short-subunit alcohol dehydrogenase family)
VRTPAPAQAKPPGTADAPVPGRRVLLTGASSGIGKAAALRLARAGYQVVGTARDPEAAAARIEAEIGGKLPFTLAAMDLAVPDSIEAGYARALAALGGIDILVNNAGMGELGSVEDTPLRDSRRMFEVNYFGPVALVKLAVPGMRARGQGVIVQLGSIVHDLQFPFKATYCASKSALTGFSMSLRYELYPHGIRVHILEPGWVRSEFHDRLRPAGGPSSPYAHRLKPFLDFSRDSDPEIPDGDFVARIIQDAIEDPATPVRVPVGREAKTFRLARRFLSNAMLDRLLLRKLAKKGEAL